MAQIAVPKGNELSPKKSKGEKPKLLHPILHQIPLEIRFGIQGVLSNAIFMILYNGAIELFHGKFEAATIYAVIYFFYIPIGHFLSSVLVFGWPKAYVSNLLSNYPVGLTAIVLGSACTAYLDKIDFNEKAERFVKNIVGRSNDSTEEDSDGEFYSSLVVLAITGVYSYLASSYVNKQPSNTGSTAKKEL